MIPKMRKNPQAMIMTLAFPKMKRMTNLVHLSGVPPPVG